MKLPDELQNRLKQLAKDAFLSQSVVDNHFAKKDVQQAYNAYNIFLENSSKKNLDRFVKKVDECEVHHRVGFSELHDYLNKVNLGP